LATWARSKDIRRTRGAWESTARIAIRNEWGATQAGNGSPQRTWKKTSLDHLREWEAQEAEEALNRKPTIKEIN
jgi:hypothetical protein